MKIDVIARLQKIFEQAAHKENDTEYWLARELQELLRYSKWGNFAKVIEKAVIACTNSGQPEEDHFLGVRKMVTVSSDAEREIDDIILTHIKIYCDSCDDTTSPKR